jgi:hypothetical protein
MKLKSSIIPKVFLLVALLSLAATSQAHASWLSRILSGHHYKIHHKHHKSSPTPQPTPDAPK